MSDTTRSPDGPAAGGTGSSGAGPAGGNGAGRPDQPASLWSSAAVYGPIPTGPQAHAQPLDRSALPGGATLPEPGDPLPPAPVPVWAPPAPQPRKKSLRERLRLERLGIEKKPEPTVAPTGLAAAAVAAQESDQAAEQTGGGALGAVSPYSREASSSDPYSPAGGYGGNGAYGSSGFGSPGYGASGATAVGAAAAGAALAGSAGAGGAAGAGTAAAAAPAGVAGSAGAAGAGGVAVSTGYPSTDGPSTAVIPAVPITAYSGSGDVLEPPQPLPRISAPRRTRKARLRLARLDPWSVMKTAFLFSIAAGIMFVVAVYVIWGVVSASELFASLNGMVQDVLSTPGDTTPFRIEDYVNTQKVMGVTALLAVVDVVIFTALATLGSFLYNLAATMLGGLEVTLAED